LFIVRPFGTSNVGIGCVRAQQLAPTSGCEEPQIEVL
jgi:hypothetical protein